MQQQVEIQQDITPKTLKKLKNEEWNDIGDLKPATEHELKSLVGVIYMFLNTINNKKMIGQTIRTFHVRYYNTWATYASNEYFRNALLKYGQENFKVYILESGKNKQQLDKLEKKYIKKYNSFDSEYGYNQTKGGKMGNYYPSKDPKVQDIYFKKAKKLHNNKYSYENSIYLGLHEKMEIHCNKCNTDFWQQANNHLVGKGGCPICKKENWSNWSRLDKFDFINKAEKVHNKKYSYEDIKYVNRNTKIKIYCNHCKDYFLQTPSIHLSGSGCKRCYFERKTKTNNIFIKEVKLIHNNKFDYTNFIYINSKTKSEIKCNKCNKILLQNPNEHLNIKNCPLCSRNYKRLNLPIKKPITQIDLSSNNILNIFQTLAEAKRYCKNNKIKGETHIVSVCNGHRKTAGGFKWKYIN